MCKCTPEKSHAPFCGKPGCEWPKQSNEPDVPVAQVRIEVPVGAFMDLVAASKEAQVWLEKAVHPTAGEQFLNHGRGWIDADRIRQRLRWTLDAIKELSEPVKETA